MTAASATLDGRPIRAGMGAAVVPLLALMVFINYVDRGNFGTAAPLIKDELHLSAGSIGLLTSAFFWSYTPCQLLAGWLTERFSPYRVLAVGLAMWSLATAATGLVSGFAALLVLRVLLGLGESAAFPCSSKLIGKHLPQHRMAGANGLILVGTSLGPAFGVFFGGIMMAHVGWRPSFLLFGLASLLWLVPWLLSTRQSAAAKAAGLAADAGDPLAPSYAEVIVRREAWGAGLGHFCLNYAFYFVVSWMPLYLVKARGFSMSHMALVGGEIYLIYAASLMVLGWANDRLIAAGRPVELVRKGFHRHRLPDRRRQLHGQRRGRRPDRGGRALRRRVRLRLHRPQQLFAGPDARGPPRRRQVDGLPERRRQRRRHRLPAGHRLDRRPDRQLQLRLRGRRRHGAGRHRLLVRRGAPRHPAHLGVRNRRQRLSRFTSRPSGSRDPRHVAREPQTDHLQDDPLRRGVGRCALGLGRDRLTKAPPMRGAVHFRTD